jgi:hypothetical protein
MTVSDDRTHLRARFSVPADRELPPGRHLLHRENIMSQILNEPPNGQPGNGEPPRDRRPSPRRSSAWRPSARGLLATAAAMALVAGVGVTAAEKLSAQPGAASSATPETTVTAVLDAAAQAAAAGPAVKIGPNQDFYVKAQVTANFPVSKLVPQRNDIFDILPPPAKPVTQLVEGWTAQSQAKESLWKVDGQSRVLGPGTGLFVAGAPFITMGGYMTGKAPGGSILYPTYAYLQSLPTNPRQLLDLIQKQTPADVPDKLDGTFAIIEQLLSTTILPPQTAAALYRAAALIPGMTIVPDVTDGIGRHGIGISLPEDVYKTDEDVWIFSQTTHQFLGVRERAVVPGPQKETHTLVSAVLARGVANSPGGTPRLTNLVK